MSKKLFIKTYGCQMNVYDSARMADALAPHGYARVDRSDDADLIILNTCHIREKAAEKVYSELGRLRQLRARRRAAGGDLVIGVAGCVAQAEGGAMLERAPFVDIVVGPQTYHRLPELLHRRARGENGVIDTEFPVESKFDLLPGPSAPSAASAFLTVQEGCDRFCTFCVVPYTRGAEESRPAAAVLDEARQLVAAGAREITLLGQNVNAYHGKGPDGRSWSLARLIAALAEIGHLARIRYTTSHPRDMTDDLIEAHATIGKLMPFLHLPVQSGSDAMLEAMNRRHRADDYLRIVERLRRVRPDIALSSDFIVGFPGETEADFRATMALVREIGFAQAFSFKYSPRPGTPAAERQDQVPEPRKTERLLRLQALIDAQTRTFNETRLGMTMDVLFEKAGKYTGQIVGRSPWLQPVQVDAPPSLIGTIARARITGLGTYSLHGELLDKPAAVGRRVAPSPLLTEATV